MASVKNEQTVIGNIGNVYELRRVGKDNRAVVDFSVAVTPRVREGDEWKDGETTWVSCTAWDRLAENIAASFKDNQGNVKKGDRVIVLGKVKTKPEFTKDDGTVIPAREYVSVDYIGIELGFAPAHSDRQIRANGGSSNDSSSRPAPEKKAAPAKKAPVKKSNDTIDDLDDDFDFDDPF